MNLGNKYFEQKFKKSCSTSSIYLSSSISSPNVDLLIKSVSTIIHSQLIEDMQLGKTVSIKSDLYYFSEEKYVNESPGCFYEEKLKILKKTPNKEELKEFIDVNSILNYKGPLQLLAVFTRMYYLVFNIH
jgi:hypothetical protein